MTLLSPAVKSAASFTLVGAAFALANLLLARYLPTEIYGEFSLVLAIAIMAIPLGTLGLDAIVLRHKPGLQLKLIRITLLTGFVIGALVAATASAVYSMQAAYVPLIALAIVAGSAARVASSTYQSEKNYTIALWLVQSQNITLILAAIVVGAFASVSAVTVFAAYALHWTLAAVVGWLLLISFSKIKARDEWRIPWDESPPLFGYIIAAQLTWQLERLMIPKILDIDSLATFGVLSALVLAPFKMLQAGIGHTLIPGLRAATTKNSRREIMVHEARTAAIIICLAIVSGFIIAPRIANIFLQGKYELGQTLIAAAVIAGSIQLLVIFVSAIVTALGSRLQLAALNRGSWLALIVSMACGWYGSRWGLPGAILGFAVGSAVRLVTAAVIAVVVWDEPETVARESTLST